MADETKKRTVRVVVPQREGFDGVWAAGQKLATGLNEIEVDDEKYAQLVKRKGITVMDSSGKILSEDQAGKSASSDSQSKADTGAKASDVGGDDTTPATTPTTSFGRSKSK